MYPEKTEKTATYYNKQNLDDVILVDFKTTKKTKVKKAADTKPQTEQQIKDMQLDNDKRYKILLERIKNELHSNNPALAEKVKVQIEPPSIERLAKKIVIRNFETICNQLGRPVQHVLNFILAELGAEGNLSGEHSEQLTIKNKLQQKNVESLIKRYVTEYVQCQLCKSPNTKLDKDKHTRIEIMQCMNCKSQRSVQLIKGRKGG